MGLHLVHALVLTPFESTLSALDWEIVGTQDYPIHFLYCKDTGATLFHSDNQKSNCAEEISKIINLLAKTTDKLTVDKQIIVLRENECEYCAKDVLKHFQ